MQKKLHTMRKIFQKGRKERGGFTLVELIVVLVLIGVIAAASVGGMIGYTSYAAYKRNNDNAKTLFAAAQSAITYYKASGKLDQFRRDVQALNHEPSYVPQSAFEAENEMLADAGEAEGRRNETISYLMIKKSDYEAIEKALKEDGNGAGIADQETKLLFQFLRDYVTDLSIWNASICVEFDAADGVVSGVLYCDRADSFTYEDASDALDIKDRGESHRRRVSLGYYSTVLSERAPASVENLELKGAELINGDSLDVQWFLDKDDQYLKGDLNYVIELWDGSAETKRVSIELSKDEVKKITREQGSQAFVKASQVILYGDGGSTEPLTLSDGSGLQFHAYLTEHEKYGSGFALSLDVLDSGLSEINSADPDAQQKLLSTYSVRRLALDKDGKHYGLLLDGKQNIRAKVYIKEKADSQLVTNEDNPLFAVYGKKDGESAESYEIANARHLYNVGFHDTGNNSYKVVQHFAWGGPNGLLSHTRNAETAGGDGEGEPALEDGDGEAPDGETPEAPGTLLETIKFFHNELPYAYEPAADGGRTRYPAFPGIRELKDGSILFSGESILTSSEKEKEEEEGEEKMPAGGWTIDYLTLEAPLVGQADGSYAAAEDVGLVRTNNGTIQELRLANVDVRGIVTGRTEETAFNVYAAKNVGAFCGINNGTLQNLEVLSGYVTGGENVGGVLGSFGAFDKIAECTGLTNGAEVTGLKNVGGIVGLLDGSGAGAAELSGAANTGLVYGWNNEQNANFVDVEPVEELSLENFGGIAGYVKNIQIKNCASNPAPQKGTDGTAAALTEEQIQERLNGNFVGGIVGYLDGTASVAICAAGTTASMDSPVYVLGENFVGGIVGMNASSAALKAENEDDKKSNAASVIGRRFVGGIVGANGKLAEGIAPAAATQKDIVTDGINPAPTVEGWVNSGAVMAAADPGNAERAAGSIRPAYVGGIAGVNAGTIKDCEATGDSSASPLFERLGAAQADYVGGLAGSNSGSMETEKTLAVPSKVRGRNFVGGLVGYNDGTRNGGAISGYSVSGTSVSGGSFVGGAVGLNTSAALLSADGGLLVCDAAAVTGGSYVGGYAGANIVALTGNTNIIQSGNAGNVTASGGFAGGLFGYNRVVIPDVLERLFDESADGNVISMLTAADGGEVNLLAENIFMIDEQDTRAADSLTVTQNKETAGGEQPEDGTSGPVVNAKIFAGGVLGYNASHTELKLKDFQSNVAVTATSAAETSRERISKYGQGKRYSFSGGILGYVTENTTLENCSTSGTVQADDATYLGGLAELNEGHIISCKAATVGREDRSFVGGIVGVNGYVISKTEDGTDDRKAGELEKCMVPSGTTVTGSSTVGGMAAENYGSIFGTNAEWNPNQTGSVNAGGTDIGGIAGINYSEIKEISSVNVKVNAGNSYEGVVGGIVGTNEGSLTGVIINFTAAIIGGNKTGGLVGVNNGLIGETDGGGICQSYATVTTNGGMAGGIVGENLGIVEKTRIMPTKEYALQANGTASLGGLVGVNREFGTIFVANDDLEPGRTPTISTVNATYVGGIAGENYGMIDRYETSGDDEYARILFNVSDTAANPSTIGGAAGRNEGTIHNILYTGTITGNGDTGNNPNAIPMAYGGIAGINAGNGIIEECCVGIAGTRDRGSEASIISNGRNYVGGVAGCNMDSATIRKIRYKYEFAEPGQKAEITSHGALATGGVVGINQDSATLVDIVSEPHWIITAQNGNALDGTVINVGPVGGIVGLHTSKEGLYGLINEAGLMAGNNNTAVVGISSDGEAVGGIVGRMQIDAATGGSFTMQDCKNYGAVSGKSKVGGILGEWKSAASGSISGCENGKEPKKDNDSPLDVDKNAVVTAQDASGAGIVGCFSDMAQGRVELFSCKNFGEIKTPNSFGAGIASLAAQAGVLGSTGGEQQTVAAANIVLTDCVNAGRLTFGAGIAVYNSANNVSLTLNRCRNYGRPEKTEDEARFAGLAAVLNENNFDADCTSLGAGQITIQNCIGTADVRYPTVPKGTKSFGELKTLFASENNFYYSSEISQETESEAEESTGDGADETEQVPVPKVIETAGIGSAVSYQTGAYQSPEDQEPKSDLNYLAAVSRTNDNEYYDPNSEDSEGAEGNKLHGRDNYYELEMTLTGACLSLERDEKVDVEKAPKPVNLQAENNGGLLELSWENENDPDSSEDPGIVYSTTVELFLYDTEEGAESAKDAAEKGSLSDPTVYQTALYGGVTEHSLRVSPSWMEKWVLVRVINYAYSGQPTDPALEYVKIVPALKSPSLTVRLEKPLASQPAYYLYVINAQDYTDCTLSFKLRSETIEDEKKKSKTYTAQIDLDGNEPKAIPLDGGNGVLRPEEGEGLELFSKNNTTDVRLMFTEIQVSPKKKEEAAQTAYFSDEAEAVAQTEAESTEEDDMRAPSQKTSFSAICPAIEKLTNGFAKGMAASQRTESTSKMFVLTNPEAAIYRAEVLQDVQIGDTLVKGVAAAWAQREIDSENATLIVPIPQGYDPNTSSVRMYPLSPKGGQAELAYLVAEGLSGEELLKSPYVVNPNRKAETDTSKTGETETDTQAETDTDTAAVQAEEPEESEAEQNAAPVQVGIPEMESADLDLVQVSVADGYSVSQRVDGSFDVYASEFLKAASPYRSNLLTPKASEEGVMKTSAEDGSSVGGSSVGSSRGGSSGGSSPSGGSAQTEPETESEPQTESEDQSEPASESESQSESETETEYQSEYPLVPPTAAHLSLDWEQTTGVDENGVEREPAAEDVFRNGLTMVADPVPNVSGYLMRAGFYTAMPAEGEDQAPLQQNLLTDMSEFDSMLILDMVDNTFTFQNLPSSYAGSYLCAQIASISMDGMWMSDWSDYLWMRLPAVRMDAREAVRGSIEENYAVTVTDANGVMSDMGETTLLHPLLQWYIMKNQAGWEDSGWRMSFYGLLEPTVKPDSDAYKEPTFTVDLMRSANNLGYQLERSLTDEEQDEWHELHPNEEMPQNLHVIVPVEENAELFQKEHEVNTTLQRLYEITLDENALGENAYTYRYEQSVPGLGSQVIENVCARIQIREYSDNEFSNEVTMIEFCLILPDAEEDGDAAFLYDYRSVLGTHSIILEPLANSAFEEPKEGITANRMQYTYLLNSQTRQEGQEELLDYQRVLKPGEEYDKAFDPEKEGLDKEEYKYYELLPRNYRPLLIWRTGTDEELAQRASEAQQAAQAQMAMQQENEGIYFEGDGSIVFEQEDVPAGGWEQSATETEPHSQGGTEVWTEVGIDPNLTEHQTETAPESQMQAPVQTETITEPQTQAQMPATESWTEAPASEPAQAVPAAEPLVGLGVFDRGNGL